MQFKRECVLGDFLNTELEYKEMRQIIRHPRAHTLEEMSPLFDKFKLEIPDLIDEWRRVESAEHYKNLYPENYGQIDKTIDEVFKRAWSFIPENADCDGSSAIVSAFVDFRKLMAEEATATDGRDGVV